MRAEPNDDVIMREMGHLNAVIARRARQSGGATGTSGILALLAGHEEAMAEGFAPRLMSQVDLADAIGIRPQSIGPFLSQLESDGFVGRARSEDDRRAQLVELTDAGRAEAQAARAEQRVFARETLSVLTDAEKRQLLGIVRKLNTTLS